MSGLLETARILATKLGFEWVKIKGNKANTKNRGQG